MAKTVIVNGGGATINKTVVISDTTINSRTVEADINGTTAAALTHQYLQEHKQDKEFIELDEYLLSPDHGKLTNSDDLARLNDYLVNKVAVASNIYYLTLSNLDTLVYICVSSLAQYNQLTLTRHNGVFQLTSAGLGTIYHDRLLNLDFEHSGHTGFAGIKLGTTAYWNSIGADYRPPVGMIIVYTDYKNGKPAIKVSGGNAYLPDIPFVDEGIEELLEAHITDESIHVSPEEKGFWNNKLNFVPPEAGNDLLEFNRY